MGLKTIFLDRDGVINHEVNYLHKVKDIQFIDGIFDTCHLFLKYNYEIIIVTNQSGISRGLYTSSQFDEIKKWMNFQFRKREINILDTFHCPHLPNSNCFCRKPKPGLFLKAQSKYNINMAKSWMIGDKESDIIAANAAGIFNTILVRSGHKINEDLSNAKFILDSIANSAEVIKK
jgi:D-glycero-D-manno-heptose 1,7-bisphosphate phosphatase